ncbi:putative DNA polymerase [Golovinomyces cichoracearum]|uniref:DNA-directed DNA polymerase n=1 Tax=Golovinomyces cichoracearum TaxID=62708 RepID=A0A420IPU1_9PEZI|nr:putative DNA polymerase [Golovinomyces cichoracearum]
MNSLYGRFGLNPEGIEVVITNEEEADKIILKNKNVKVTPLLSKNLMVTYEKDEDDFCNMNISVPISSAIASYSRITMSHYISKYSKNIHYVDTDGIKVNVDIDLEEIDAKKLGKMKFEYLLDQFVALGPKAYGGVFASAYKDEGNNGEIVKIKGYSSTLPFKEFRKGINSNNKIELKHKK